MSINNLKLLTVVGKGSFGTVFLGQLKTTGKYYALKMLQKHQLLKKESNYEYAKFEINVTKNWKHPNVLSIDFVK